MKPSIGFFFLCLTFVATLVGCGERGASDVGVRSGTGKALEVVLASWGRSPDEYRARSERYLAERADDTTVSTGGRLRWLEATAKLPVDSDAPDAAERIRVQSELIVLHQRAFYGVAFTNAWLSIGRLSRRLTEENRTMRREIRTRNLWAARGQAASRLAHSAVFFYCLWGEVPGLPSSIREAYIGEIAALGILDESELEEIRARFRAHDSLSSEARPRDGGGRRRH